MEYKVSLSLFMDFSYYGSKLNSFNLSNDSLIFSTLLYNVSFDFNEKLLIEVYEKYEHCHLS